MRNIPLKKLIELRSQIFDCCHKGPGIERLLTFEAKIVSLKEKQKNEVLLSGLHGACNGSNIKAIEAFCDHPTFKIDFTTPIIDMAIEKSSTLKTLEYILLKAPIVIPHENLEVIKCNAVIGSLYDRLEYHKNYNFEETVFLFNYLYDTSEKLELAQKERLPVFDLFDVAIQSKNTKGLRLFIDKYNIHGKEAGIEHILNTKSKKTKDMVVALITSHKEQRMLQKEINITDNNLSKTVYKI